MPDKKWEKAIIFKVHKKGQLQKSAMSTWATAGYQLSHRIIFGTLNSEMSAMLAFM